LLATLFLAREKFATFSMYEEWGARKIVERSGWGLNRSKHKAAPPLEGGEEMRSRKIKMARLGK
jgi:hypothetical protein